MTRLTLLTTALLLSATALYAQNGTPGAKFIANWDANGNGEVTVAEVSAKRETMFTSFDNNGDDNLSEEEYAKLEEMRASAQAEMKTKMASVAGQGGAKRKGQGQGMGMNGGMTFESLDTNLNGDVSRQEFLSHSADFFTQMDRNSDGVLTAADFSRK